MNKSVIQFILKGWKQQLTDAEIKQSLRESKWNETIINQSFAAAKKIAASKIVSSTIKYDSVSVRRLKHPLLLTLVGVFLLFGLFLFSEYKGYISTEFFFKRSEVVWYRFLNSKPVYSRDFSFLVNYKDTNNAYAAGGIQLKARGQAKIEEQDNILLAHGNVQAELSDEKDSKDALFPFIYDSSQGIVANMANLPNKKDETQNQWIKTEAPEALTLLLRALLTSPNQTFISDRQFVEWEKIDGKESAHFVIHLNADRVKQYTGSNPRLAELQLQTLDVWVAQKSGELQKITIITNAPSLDNLNNISKRQASIAAADKQRIADVREVANKLEAFYNDHGGYPNAENGVITNFVPTYLATMPTPPTAHGICSDYSNVYWYSGSGKKARSKRTGETIYESYTLNFCLEHPIENFKPGQAIARPTGITTNVPCPGEKQDCFLPEAVNQLFPPNTPLHFGAQLSLEIHFEDTTLHENISVPSETISLPEFLSSLKKSQ